MSWTWLDDRPLIIAIAGSNGAGKTTFYHAHIEPTGLPLVNADRLADELDLPPYAAARVADSLRRELVHQRESFAFETVFSDPVGDKLDFMQETAATGYTVCLCFIGLSSAKLSAQRVAMRVSQGGHDVPADKITSRFPRTLANFQAAITALPHVLVFDNSNMAQPYQQIAIYTNGVAQQQVKPLPRWFQNVVNSN